MGCERESRYSIRVNGLRIQEDPIPKEIFLGRKKIKKKIKRGKKGRKRFLNSPLGILAGNQPDVQ